MKKLFREIKSSSIFRVASLNSVLVFSRLTYGFLASKIVAVYLGPQGLALLGNFRDFSQVLYSFSAKNFESGIIKYIAEKKHSINSITSTLIRIWLIILLLTSPILYVFSEFFSVLIFNTQEFYWVFNLLCFTLPLISANLIILSIVNGKKLHKILVKIQVLGFILNATLLLILTVELGFKGAVIASIIALSLQLFISLFFTKTNIIAYCRSITEKKINYKLAKGLLSYFLMAVFSISLVFIVNFIIRNKLIDTISVNHGGYWEAIIRISSFYLMFFSSMLTFFLLPKLSEVKRIGEYRVIMKNYLSLIIPLSFVIFLIVFLMKDFVILTLLTSEFSFISSILIWQLGGDFLRIIVVSLAYQFHAKRRVKAYYVSDALFYMSYLFLSLLLIDSYGVKGVLIAYIVANVIHLFVVIGFLRNELFNLNENAIIEG